MNLQPWPDMFWISMMIRNEHSGMECYSECLKSWLSLDCHWFKRTIEQPLNPLYILYCIILYYVILCYIMLHYVTLCYIILYYIILYIHCMPGEKNYRFRWKFSLKTGEVSKTKHTVEKPLGQSRARRLLMPSAGDDKLACIPSGKLTWLWKITIFNR